MIEAANGKSMSAMKIFSITLGYFKDHALQELKDATGTKIAQVHLSIAQTFSTECWVQLIL